MFFHKAALYLALVAALVAVANAGNVPAMKRDEDTTIGNPSHI
jgi:hypothetical protein